jgi:hypothetical protein
MSSSRSQNDGEKMRNINLRNWVLPASLLAIAMAATTHAGCSTGSDSNATGGAGSTGTGGSAPTGTSTGTGGSTTTGTGGSATATGTGGSTTTGTGGSTTTGVGGSTGTGGAVATTGSGGAPATTGVCAGTGTRALSIDQGKVDDFEEAMILPGWSSFNDVQPTMNAFKIAQEAGGAIGTGHSGHYMGTGAKTPVMGGFGVGVVYNMAIDHTAMIYCVDVTAFDGLTFWAKAATAGAKVGVNFVVPKTNMTPDGDCTTACYNHPQKLVTLTADWQQYSVAFSAAMGGTGAKVEGRIQQVGFLSPDANWDFSIDEIQLYKGTPPTTAVGGNSTM